MSSTTDTPRQNFRRVDGPYESDLAGDNSIYELSNYYEGEVTPSGRTPCMEVTFYVTHVPAAETNLPDEDGDRWGVDEMTHTWLSNPANDYGPEYPEDEEYSYEGGSDLWYLSEEAAVVACRDHFAAHDESWKLNDWTPE